MAVTTSVRELSIREADALLGQGAAYVDLRRISEYLDVHVPASLALEYEFGPGMPGRARDCIPLSMRLILLDDGSTDIHEATAALRGKGFVVEGVIPNGVKAWADVHGTPVSTDIIDAQPKADGAVLDVGDPGAEPPPDALRIPISRLWTRISELPEGLVVIAAGRGVRAALAVGMLERAERDVAFWETLRGPRRRFGKRGVRWINP